MKLPNIRLAFRTTLVVGIFLTLSQNARAESEDFVPSKHRGKRMAMELGGYTLGTLGGTALGLGSGYLAGQLITAGRDRRSTGDDVAVLALMIAGGVAGAVAGGTVGVYEAGTAWGHANGKLGPTIGGTLIGDVVGISGLVGGVVMLNDPDKTYEKVLGATLVILGLVSFSAGPIIGYELSTRTERAETRVSLNALTLPREPVYSLGVAF